MTLHLGGTDHLVGTDGTKDISWVRISPDGVWIAAGNWNGDILLWERSIPTRKETLKAKGFAIYGVAFSPNSKTLAAADKGGNVLLWDIKSSTMGYTVLHEDNSTSANMVSFSTDGTLGSGHSDGMIQLWDVENCRLRKRWKAHNGRVFIVAWHPMRADIMASGGEDDVVCLWTTKPGNLNEPPVNLLHSSVNWEAYGSNLHEPSVPSRSRSIRYQAGLWGSEKAVTSLAFHRAGNILASGFVNGAIVLWDVEQKKQIGPPLWSKSDTVLDLAFSPTDQMLVSSHVDGSIRRWGIGDQVWQTRAREISGRLLTKEEWLRHIEDETLYMQAASDL